MFKSNKKFILTILGAAVLITIVAFVLRQEPKGPEEQEEIFVKVSGVVKDARDFSPIEGVDLTVGDTSIRTGEAGTFVFPSVSTLRGIRLTHPELLRAMVKLPETDKPEQLGDILFNVPLYNLLITIIDLEARDKLEEVYDKFSPEVKVKLNKEQFRTQYVRLFSESDVTNQEIYIKSLAKRNDYLNEKQDIRFKEVVEFSIVNKGEGQVYRFIYEPKLGQWFLIL